MLTRALALLPLALLAACSEVPEAAPPVTSPVTSPSVRQSPQSQEPAKDCVAATLAGLSQGQKARQLLMIGTRVDSPRKTDAGAVFLAGRSTRTAAALKADIAAITKVTGVPPLVALDQEGGSVQTLKGPDFPAEPSAQRLGQGTPQALKQSTGDTAERLSAIGVTMNLAPVADTVPAGIGTANPPIGAFRRQFGATPEQVANAIEVAVPASQDAGVLTVLKHFPGLGRTRANTDTSDKAVDATATADDPYLKPFAAGIEAGSAAVMMSSARYPKLDDENIAAFSEKIVTGLLREKMGFDGLVVSDDLGAADAVAGVPVGQRAVKFVAAGGDMPLSIRPEDAEPMAKALAAAAGTSPEFAERVDESATRVLRAKERAGVLRCG
jgi:beta-N-acetylhexosaminidase